LPSRVTCLPRRAVHRGRGPGGKLEKPEKKGAGRKDKDDVVASCCHWWWSCCCCHCSGSFYLDNVVRHAHLLHNIFKSPEMTEEPYQPASNSVSCPTHNEKATAAANSCNHIKKSDSSSVSAGGARAETQAEHKTETVQTDCDTHYQDNLAFRASHPDEYESEFEREMGEREDSYQERTSGSFTDSYEEGSSSVQGGYRIPYRLMRDCPAPPLSPPPQPTHRAPGLPPSYRKYSRTILVEASGQAGLARSQPSYVSTICVQPGLARSQAGGHHSPRSAYWGSEADRE